jgi:outer membrane immunogenic protein
MGHVLLGCESQSAGNEDVMKKLLLAGVALTFGGPAWAASPAGPAAVWTGCYIGGHAGIGFGRTDFTNSSSGVIALPGGSVPIPEGASVLGGGQIGCDDQFAANWLLGVAGDFSWAQIEGQSTDPFFNGKHGLPQTLHSRTDSIASATARLGYVWDRFVVYAKGGAAWAHDRYVVDNFVCGAGGFPFGCDLAGSETRFGWTAGFGAEYALANNWSIAAEFDYYGFGNKSLPFEYADTGAASPYGFGVASNLSAIKLILNYHFTSLLR